MTVAFDPITTPRSRPVVTGRRQHGGTGTARLDFEPLAVALSTNASAASSNTRRDGDARPRNEYAESALLDSSLRATPALALTLIAAVPTVLVTESFAAGTFVALLVLAGVLLADWMLQPSSSRVGPPPYVPSAPTPDVGGGDRQGPSTTSGSGARTTGRHRRPVA